MTSTDAATSTQAPGVGTIDMKLEVVTVPVSDVDRSKRFYQSLGWRLDADIARGDAFRVVYAVQLADALWVIHAFQKKSTRGIKTPKHEIDLIVERIKRLKKMLKEVKE